MTRLLEAGACPRDQDRDGWTPLHYATWGGGGMGCIKALLEAGASPDIQNPVIGMASLHFAASKGHEGSV